MGHYRVHKLIKIFYLFYEIAKLLTDSRAHISASRFEFFVQTTFSNNSDKKRFVKSVHGNWNRLGAICEQGKKNDIWTWFGSKFLANNLSNRISLWDKTGIGPLLALLIKN